MQPHLGEMLDLLLRVYTRYFFPRHQIQCHNKMVCNLRAPHYIKASQSAVSLEKKNTIFLRLNMFRYSVKLRSNCSALYIIPHETYNFFVMAKGLIENLQIR